MTEIEQEQPVPRLNVPYFFSLSLIDQQHALESLIFASEEPLTTRMMHRILVLEDPTQEIPGQQSLPLDGEAVVEVPKKTFDVPQGYFDELIEAINADLDATDRPFRVLKVAGGYQFATTPQHGQLVQRLLKSRSRKRLTQAALETLAIIAYRQPITKVEVDAIRGVNAGEVVNSLVEKGLVVMVGRSESIGKPLLYGTTEEFLRIFGLNSLSDLPKLREIDDLLKTTTTILDMEEGVRVTTDHKTLRKQLALLLDAGVEEDDSEDEEKFFSAEESEKPYGNSSEPTSEDASEPTSEDASEPTSEDASEPTSEDASEQTSEDSSEPANEDTSEQADEESRKPEA